MKKTNFSPKSSQIIICVRYNLNSNFFRIDAISQFATIYCSITAFSE